MKKGVNVELAAEWIDSLSADYTTDGNLERKGTTMIDYAQFLNAIFAVPRNDLHIAYAATKDSAELRVKGVKKGNGLYGPANTPDAPFVLRVTRIKNVHIALDTDGPLGPLIWQSDCPDMVFRGSSGAKNHAAIPMFRALEVVFEQLFQKLKSSGFTTSPTPQDVTHLLPEFPAIVPEPVSESDKKKVGE